MSNGTFKTAPLTDDQTLELLKAIDRMNPADVMAMAHYAAKRAMEYSQPDEVPPIHWRFMQANAQQFAERHAGIVNQFGLAKETNVQAVEKPETDTRRLRG